MKNDSSQAPESSPEAPQEEVVYKKERPLLRLLLWIGGSLVAVVMLLFTIGLIMGFSGQQAARFDGSGLAKKAEDLISGKKSSEASPLPRFSPSPTSSPPSSPSSLPSASPGTPSPTGDPKAASAAGKEAAALFKRSGKSNPEAFWRAFNEAAEAEE